MKKLFFLMTLMMPLLFASCGDDNDEPASFSKQLVGEWVEVNGPVDELFHFKFESNHKGLFWITDNNEIIAEAPFTWAQEGDGVVISLTQDGITTTGRGYIKDGLLYIYGDEDGADEYIVYKKVK